MRVASAGQPTRRGSFVKYGADKTQYPQGHLTLDHCAFRSLNTTTGGINADGGDGLNVPSLTLKSTVLRVAAGYCVDYKGHAPSWFTWDTNTVFAGAGGNKTDLPIPMTPADQADTRIMADLMAVAAT